jgi:hypothetical protein
MPVDTGTRAILGEFKENFQKSAALPILIWYYAWSIFEP